MNVDEEVTDCLSSVGEGTAGLKITAIMLVLEL